MSISQQMFDILALRFSEYSTRPINITKNNIPPPYSHVNTINNSIKYDNLKSVLQYSDENDHIEIVKYMFKHADDIHNKTYKSKLHATSLFKFKQSSKTNKIIQEICTNGNIGGVQYLIKHGVDKNRIMYFSLKYKRLDIFKYLIDNGADVNAALRYSVAHKCLDNLKCLHECGVDIHRNNRIALRIIIEAYCLGIHNYSDWLHYNTDRAKNIALCYSDKEGYSDIITFLITTGDDIHGNVVAAVCFGTAVDHPEIIKCLVSELSNRYLVKYEKI